MSDYRLRQARHDDAVEAAAVMRRSITALCVADHRHDEQVLARWLANKTPATVRSWIEQSDNLIYVAERVGEIVAVAAMKTSGEITRNYVAPEARFTGISKAMMAALEAKARELGLTECCLTSTDTAQAFYRALGYRDDGTEMGAFTARPACRMRKAL